MLWHLKNAINLVQALEKMSEIQLQHLKKSLNLSLSFLWKNARNYVLTFDEKSQKSQNKI